uniref:Uncharacterized protein n=1 Tax=Arundo donax TaxID=35708 RepID=A0A0A9ADR6_ARUDO
MACPIWNAWSFFEKMHLWKCMTYEMHAKKSACTEVCPGWSYLHCLRWAFNFALTYIMPGGK